MPDYDPVGLLRDRLQAVARRERWRIVVAFGGLGLAAYGFGLFDSAGRVEPERDRWGRRDLVERFPVDGQAQTLELSNDSARPVFVEIASPAWAEARTELLLPGDSQWLEVAHWEDAVSVARVVALDIGAPDARRDFDLSADWVRTILAIEADGSVTCDERPKGDFWPKRGLVWFETNYRLPVRVAVPFDVHERPPAAHLARRQWIGPGTGETTDGCAYAMRDGVRAACWLPRETGAASEFALDETAPARILVAADGSITRESLSLVRQVGHWLGM